MQYLSVSTALSDRHVWYWFERKHYWMWSLYKTFRIFDRTLCSIRLIRKFRNFNNYVYLSATFVNILRLNLVSLILLHCNGHFETQFDFIAAFKFLSMFFAIVYNNWLVVMCYMFYVDIVKVFKTDITRKYLKSFLFAWGTPITVLSICGLLLFLFNFAENANEEILVSFVGLSIILVCIILPVMTNIYIFIRLLCCLFPCKVINACALTKREQVRLNFSRLCTVTIMFVFSNVFVVTFIIWDMFALSELVRIGTFCLHIVVLTLFIPLVKSNRALWYEYYESRLKRPCRDYYCCIVCQ